MVSVDRSSSPADVTGASDLAADADTFSFSLLFEDGLRHVQRLSGSLWTDYNDHDPGITILQQACYALSEVAYRIDFPIADLVAERGRQEGTQAFYTGDAILSCDPVTITDLRKLAYDAVHNLRNIWIEESEPDKPCGLFRVYVEPYEYDFDPATEKRADPRPALWRTLTKYRPLAQDILDVVLLRRVAISIDADLTINSDSSADDIVASIIAALQTRMVQAPGIRTVDDLFAAGRSPDQIFEGPLLDIGSITSQTDRPSQVAIDDIEQIVRHQTGVVSIQNLQVLVDGTIPDGDGRVIDLGLDGIPGLEVEATITGLRLRRGGVSQTLNPMRIAASARYFRSSDAQSENDASTTMALNSYKTLPFGTRREQSDFTPIRLHFPMVYGVGSDGLPTRDGLGWISTISDTMRDAQAKRLKAYLHGFDQIAGNILAQLNHVPELFAVDRPPEAATYFTMPIASDDLATDHPALLSSVMRSMDPARSRREAMLDHLLARFDEAFDDSIWDRQQRGGMNRSVDANRDRRIRAKEHFLRDMRNLSGGRGSGRDYASKHNAKCALEGRIALLAGLDDVLVLEHILLRNLDGDLKGEQAISFYEHRVTIIVPHGPDVVETGLKSLVETVVFENCPVHIESRTVWLDPDEMARIEGLYMVWREARAAAVVNSDARPQADRAASALRLQIAAYWIEAGDRGFDDDP